MLLLVLPVYLSIVACQVDHPKICNTLSPFADDLTLQECQRYGMTAAASWLSNNHPELQFKKIVCSPYIHPDEYDD